MNEIENIRRCKKCGAELPAGSKGNKCQYCKAEGAENAKKICGGILAGLATVGSIVLAVMSDRNKKNDRT